MIVEVLQANRPLPPFSMRQIIDSASVLISDIGYHYELFIVAISYKKYLVFK
jgi:hypothetical protein